MQLREDVLTLTVAWQTYFPQFAVPEEKWIRSWAYHNPLETVLAAFEHILNNPTDYSHVKAAEHMSRLVTILLKNVTYEK
jgi:hypothetical protein